MRIFRLLIAYDGTGLVGWQRQPDGVSVQGLLEDALAPLHTERPVANAAGRTDAGVHATGQVVSVGLDSPLDASAVLRAANARLPPHVRVIDAAEAPAGFHARFDARAKTYEYRIVSRPVCDPFLHRFAWHVPMALDVDLMSEAAACLEGTHDFRCFQSAGSDVRTTVREVFESTVRVVSGSMAAPLVPVVGAGAAPVILYRITGSGFLRHMVRAIAGTLVEIGRHAAAPSLIPSLLAGEDRAAAGPTAPAHALCLTHVSYERGPEPVATHR
jgi:tRNA pseudouridine38-40 synthase